MKKIYLILVLGIIGLFALFVYLNGNLKNENYTQTEFTPRELRDIENLKKKEKREQGIGKADKPDMFTKYFKDITTRISEKESAYKMNYKVAELNKAIRYSKSLKTYKAAPGTWVQRGPSNIGGRTRAIIVDPDDATHQTWFASAATGGIWKTTDKGANWTHLSADFSNLAINAMAMAESNTQVIYAGTGESFPGGTYLKGNGIWKSTDKGGTWTQLTNTINEDFAYINRLIIDPDNENIVIAATETGIFKSTDGGDNWTEVYASNNGVEDIVADPTTFDVIFAGENSVGILRSTDAGNNWLNSSSGLADGSRYEVDVSPVNHNNVFTSVNVSDTESPVYISEDNGLTWKKFDDDENFLSTQGNYDNTIAAHPYNADEVFIGGVDVWKVKFNGTETTSDPKILGAYTENTTFLSFVNFGGDYLGGGMSIEDQDTTAEDVAIEIRFGEGSQKAHRFTVPSGSTSGVAAVDYTYQDYVDVPFIVWDKTNDKQLMVSFRDQADNDEFDLTSGSGDEDRGREYIFVNSIAYNATNPDVGIATAGGHLHKNLYMFWPTLTEGEIWTPAALPLSKIVVDYGTQTLKAGVKTSIADSYGRHSGPNRYDQNAGKNTTYIPGLHPDHHNITIIPTGAPNFLWIEGNDGGIGYSDDNGVTLDQIPTNYITTQFYGVAKNPEANEYFGGMQDNGSWQSPVGSEASSTSDYFFRLGGDGFECLWHATDPNLMLGSIYNNDIYRSSDKGSSWSEVSGITADDGPFITRLSASKEDPYMIFAVGGRGVYKSVNFGRNWSMKSISTNWSDNNTASSSHNVEVSLANGKIVWAGAAMAADFDLQMQVSTDYGNTFTAVDDYATIKLDAYTSGIATHPIDENTAYLLFSLSDKPKVLRTTNLGESWEDISGFGTGDESTTGFPNVVVHCLLVMPHEPNTIWVGTDIGLFESTNNGDTWHIANNGLPPVSVYDMHIVANQVVVATHGRGIWTMDIPEIDNSTYITDFKQVDNLNLRIETDFKVSYDSVEVSINGNKNSTVYNPEIGNNNIPVVVADYGDFTTYITGYVANGSYKSNTLELSISKPTGILANKADITLRLFPNPANEYFNLDLDKKHDNFRIEIYNIKGQRIYSIEKENAGVNRFNIKSLKEGLYIVHVYTGSVKTNLRMQVLH